MARTVAKAENYSVLGWNMPGFAGSSGTPWPTNVAAAMDVVVQYAEHQLKYPPEQIVVVAWFVHSSIFMMIPCRSIGGFAATWAGMQQPRRLRGLVLDATFDDVQPLAHTIFHTLLHDVITATIRRRLDLPNGRQLMAYDGPVLLIRRTRDEIITTRPRGDDHERMCHNRANDLLVQLLAHRYPQLFDRCATICMKSCTQLQ